MRISDWSSDVCSSDLLLAFEVRRARARHQNAAIIEQMQRCAIERRVMFKTGIVILATLDQGRWVDDGDIEFAPIGAQRLHAGERVITEDRKSTRLNSSH